MADPQHPRALGIHVHRGVAIVQGELVHHQAAYVAWLKNADRSFHAALVERLEGVPMQASQAADVG